MLYEPRGGYDHLHSILKPWALRFCFIYVKVRHIQLLKFCVKLRRSDTSFYACRNDVIPTDYPWTLSSLLVVSPQQYHPQRSLLSSSKLLFTVRTVNSVTYGERAFSFSASILWNSLQSFKSALKTFLFRKFYF